MKARVNYTGESVDVKIVHGYLDITMRPQMVENMMAVNLILNVSLTTGRS